MLTDATGVLIGSSCVGRRTSSLMPVATRLGVNLSEDAVGTTAPGVAARTGKAVCVLGGEHFFDSVKAMHCAAAPIRDIRGHARRRPGHFQRAHSVRVRCRRRWPACTPARSRTGCSSPNRQSTSVIRFQVAPELLDSAMVGLIGVGVDGRQAWENGVATSLLGAGRGHELTPAEMPRPGSGWPGPSWPRSRLRAQRR